MSIGMTADGYAAKNISLRWMILNGYGIKMEDLIVGAPGWADSEKFDFTAKMDEATAERFRQLPKDEKEKQIRMMLQAMLADRCGLKVHQGTKEISAYALVVGKGGFKLKEADANNAYADGIKGANGPMGAGSFNMGPGFLVAQGITIADVADNLGSPIDSYVEDRTGIRGKYDITLRWDADPSRTDAAAAGTESEPSLFTAVQEQLGLKLVPAKVAMETVVIDRVERPSAD